MRLFGFSPLGVRQPPRSTARARLLHAALGFRARFGATTARGWRAMFFPSEFEHSLIPTPGSAWARSPWEAVQRAAADTFDRLHSGEPAAPD
jgi:hypothetical protein